MTVEQQKQISALLNEIARTLDVTKAEYNAITTHSSMASSLRLKWIYDEICMYLDKYKGGRH